MEAAVATRYGVGEAAGGCVARGRWVLVGVGGVAPVLVLYQEGVSLGLVQVDGLEAVITARDGVKEAAGGHVVQGRGG